MMNGSPSHHLPAQRWSVAPAQPAAAEALAQTVNLPPPIAQILLNRGFQTPEQAQVFLNPEIQTLPSPTEAFDQLPVALEMLINAINQQARIAICGDYDADGMTSTALLLRALRWLGARVDYAIPSRMQEGYGINCRIVEDFHAEGVAIILTVDNGIAAHAAIARARELGLAVIVTDHHDLPDTLPDANVILNPKQLPDTSPYRGMAGVGVAYILAVALAQSFGKDATFCQPLLELFTLGTIADLAPLVGINRRWVRRGLQRLPASQLAGVQALIQVSGLLGQQNLKPEAVGFQLGPRINAVGRLADPQIVIELLTTDDPAVAQERAAECEAINQRRRELCREIEQAAIAVCEQDADLDFRRDRVLLLVQPDWHHGVIGIVASRLVERYGVPVFIGTYEDEEQSHIRGSARGIPEFHVFEALQACDDLFGKYGGHKAAGGFSFAATELEAVRSRLSEFAHACLTPDHVKPLVTVDAQLPLAQVDQSFYQQLDVLHPCGIENPDPVFWSANVRIVSQRLVGQNHLKLTVQDDSLTGHHTVTALAWRWADYYPLPTVVDLAYALRLNHWNGNVAVELEVKGVRLPTQPPAEVRFTVGDRPYTCRLVEASSPAELHICNDQGRRLIVRQGEKSGTLHQDTQTRTVDVRQPPYFDIIKAALRAIEAAE